MATKERGEDASAPPPREGIGRRLDQRLARGLYFCGCALCHRVTLGVHELTSYALSMTLAFQCTLDRYILLR